MCGLRIYPLRIAIKEIPQRIGIIRKSMFLATLICLLAGLSLPAQAQDDGKFGPFNDPFRVYGGAFFASTNTKIVINGTNVFPPLIRVEDVLAVDDSDSAAWVGVQWHISRRNSLVFEFFELNRNGFTNLVPNPVAVGDLIIESGSINTAYDVSVSRLTYGYSLVRNERMDFQLRGGLHIADMSIALQLGGAVCDVTMGEMPPGCPGGQTPPLQSEDVTAPLPHFGGSFSYSITPTIGVNLEVIGFALELDNIDGSIVEIDADIVWQPWRHFGVGAGLRYFDAEVKSTGSELNGKFEIEYFGPIVYVTASF